MALRLTSPASKSGNRRTVGDQSVSAKLNSIILFKATTITLGFLSSGLGTRSFYKNGKQKFTLRNFLGVRRREPERNLFK